MQQHYLFDAASDLPALEVRYLDIPLASFLALLRLPPQPAPAKPAGHSETRPR